MSLGKKPEVKAGKGVKNRQVGSAWDKGSSHEKVLNNRFFLMGTYIPSISKGDENEKNCQSPNYVTIYCSSCGYSFCSRSGKV